MPCQGMSSAIALIINYAAYHTGMGWFDEVNTRVI